MQTFSIKSIFFICIILFLGLPINNFPNLLILIFVLFLIFGFDKIKKTKIKFTQIVFLTLSYFMVVIISNKDIGESHSVFLNERDLTEISNILPKPVIEKMKMELINRLDKQRYLRSHDGENFNNEENFNKANFVETSYAFSVEGIFNDNFTRLVNNINFKTREEVRIGQINKIIRPKKIRCYSPASQLA